MNSESFCAVPWVKMFAAENGNFHVCCMTSPYREDVLRDSSGKPYNIEIPGHFELAKNSQVLKTLRTQMLKGVKPEICSRCFEMEKTGDSSYREKFNNKYRDVIDSLKKETDGDGSVSTRTTKYLDLRLGNFCNLKCRMCHTQSSRALKKELNQIYSELDFVKKSIQVDERSDWHKSEETWTRILEYLPFVETIYLAGGEPFLIDESWEFLNKIVETGYAKQIEIEYSTNMTYLPKEKLEVWSNFKGVYVFASIDGFRDVNNYVRYPSKWSQIDENLRFLDKNMRALNCNVIGINSTIQVYNAFNLKEFFFYLLENFKNIDPYPNLEPVINREQLSLNILTPDLKKIVAKRLKDFKSEHFVKFGWFPPKDFLNQLNKLIEYMYSKDDQHLIPDFKHFTRFMDGSRVESILNIAPELSELFQN